MTSRVVARMSKWGAALLALAMLAACGHSPAPQAPHTVPGVLLWSGDLETGDLSQFQKTPWNTVGGPPPKVVQDPVRSGRYAVELALNGATASDEGICCGSRNEIEPKFRDMVAGDDLWFAFSTYLDAKFPTYHSDFQAIVQFKQNFDGSPPLEMDVEEGEFSIEGGYGHPGGPLEFHKSVGRADTGRWIDWILHVQFSPDPTVGYVEVWRDDQLVLPRFAPPGGTMYVRPADGSSRNSVKTGYYRYRGIESAGRIYFDEWRIGTSMDVVRPSPRNGPLIP
jgi:hypothetical protein